MPERWVALREQSATSGFIFGQKNRVERCRDHDKEEQNCARVFESDVPGLMRCLVPKTV
jgi:hypothetical protein